MKYTIVIEKLAEKFIMKLPRPEKERVLKAIYKLPDGNDVKKLKGHKSLMRLRVGDYRVIYTIDNGKCIILVIDAGNRGDIYNKY
ncbi:type II toxin-antitoxin system RelE/ParE family toxin [bacterium 210820-DFI.6.37]|nr:type II toxin-antitoxin system RelE/ParE family toxin [bacterium 210820-DFI.6.37]